MSRAIDIVVVAVVGLFVVASLLGSPEESTLLREYFVANAQLETGAQNLVTSIYLGFRAFDTIAETVVLLLAVSGVVLFVEHRR